MGLAPKPYALTTPNLTPDNHPLPPDPIFNPGKKIASVTSELIASGFDPAFSAASEYLPYI